MTHAEPGSGQDASLQHGSGSDNETPDTYWFIEVWYGFRRYLIKFSEDVLVFLCVWLALIALKKFIDTFQNKEDVAVALAFFHELCLGLGATLWGFLTLYDLYLIRMAPSTKVRR